MTSSKRYRIRPENGSEKYERGLDGVERILEDRYALDEDENPFYPKDNERNEYMDEKIGLIKRNGVYVYPLRHNNRKPNYRKKWIKYDKFREVYEQYDGLIVIGKGLDGIECYALDEEGNEYAPDRYAVDKNGNPYYPSTVGYDTYLVESLGLIKRFGEFVYPLCLSGKPNYRLENGKELYERVGDAWIIGRGADGDQYYARDENYVEYYPPDNTPARKFDGSIFYATVIDMNGDTIETIFPKDANSGDEFYLTYIDSCKEHTYPSRYAFQGGGRSEIYPKKKTVNGLDCEVILGKRYAVRDGQAFYPKDGYNNEYYLSSFIHESEIGDSSHFRKPTNILTSYARTNDGKVILAGAYRMFAVLDIDKKKLPLVFEKDALGALIREGVFKKSADYVTSVDASVKPPQSLRKPYHYFDQKTNTVQTVGSDGKEVKIVFNNPAQVSLIQCLVNPISPWYFWLMVVMAFVVKVSLIHTTQTVLRNR